MAQQHQWKNLQTGLFFLAALIVLTVALLIVGTNQNIFSKTYTLHTYLPDTQTLAKGTSVTLSGIEIGVIQNIELDTYEGQNSVRFDLKLRSEHRDRITSSSKATVKSIGVLGDKFMEITLGKAGETPLKDGDSLPCQPAVDWERIAGDLTGKFSTTMTRVELILEKVERGDGSLGILLNDPTLARNLSATLDDLDQNLKAIRANQGTLGRLIHDPKLYNELTATIENLDRVTGRISAGEGTLGRLVNDSTLYVGAAGAATGADTVFARLNAGKGTAGKALNDDRAYDELHRAIQDLRLLLIDMQAHPDRYLKFSIF